MSGAGSYNADSDSSNQENPDSTITTTEVIHWTVSLIDDTRSPYPSKNLALKMPTNTTFSEIRNYLVRQRMVSYVNFSFLSDTSGSTFGKKVLDENLEIGQVFSANDTVSLKLTMGARSSFYDSDSDEGTQRSGAYQARRTYERAKGYTGLSNQGATCYLNSLLQTLYMTPEFRKSLYDWDFEETCRRDFYKQIRSRRKQNEIKNQNSSDEPSHDESRDDDDFSDVQNIEEKYEKFKAQYEDKSITRQLQKLFLQLQMSDDTSTETTNLTSSFGWSDDEAFTQHDVQELLRVLFDALEKSWQGTDKENFINDMYQGEMKDYVRCLNCGHESSRKDTYLDIPLVIKGFGETKAVSSVDEAIRKFTEKEKLEGDNQYFCEKCDSKQDAEKGLTYLSFPYLLALQLKRFDFDYMTMRRVKLNDRVSFPEILDMNQYLHDQDHLQEELSSDDDANVENSNDENEDDLEARKAKREETLSKALANGEYVYELYSILIHRGSAMGGHYYAYVKSFEKDQWYCFNDSSVTVISPSQIEDTYGDIPKKQQVFTNRFGRTVVTGGNQAFGSNAYMLMYRKYNPEINITEPPKEEISPALTHVFQVSQERLQQQYAEQSAKRNRVLLKVYSEDGETEKEMKVSRETTLAEATKLALDEFKRELQEGERSRLREYQSYYKTAGKTFDDTLTLEKLRFYGAKTLILEIVGEGEEFEEYDPDKMTLKVVYLDSETGIWGDPVSVGLSKNATVGGLKEILEKKFGLPANEQIICKTDYNEFNARVLNRDNKDLRFNFRVQQGHTLYLEKIHPEADELTYEYTYTSRMRRTPLPDDIIYPKAFEYITAEKNKLQIRFTDPDKKDARHTVSAEKTESLGDLVEKIAKQLAIPVDSFKLMKQSLRTELKNMNYTLSQYNITSSIPLLVVSGKPLKQGEVLVQFELLTPTKLSSETAFLFKIPVPEKMLIEDVKKLVVEEYNQTKKTKLEELQNKETTTDEKPEEEKKKSNDSSETLVEEEVFPIFEMPPPEQLRLRELFSRFPSNVLKDDDKLKSVVRSVYSTPKVAVQILPEGEIETKKRMMDIVVFVQQFKPEEYDLGEKFEMIVNNNDTLDDFRQRINEITGTENIGLISQDRWDTTKILSLGRSKWFKPEGFDKEDEVPESSESDSELAEYKKQLKNQKDKVRLLKLRDGDLVIFRDLIAELKELSTEERNTLQAQEKSKSSSRRHGEEGVAIKEQEVDIDFFGDD